MFDIKLFRIGQGGVFELSGTTDTIEKSVQTLFEKNLEPLLGVRFLASEFNTTHGGRIDTLGLDENGCPVSRRIKEQFDNGRHYYELHGKPIAAAADILRRPDPEALRWHYEYAFRG